MNTFGFIGCGNMGGALALAVAKAADDPLLLCDHHPEKVQALCAETGGLPAESAEIAARCRYIFLGVKPQVLGALLAELSPVLKARSDRFILVSMAAGVSMEDLCAMADLSCPVILIKPNTPVAIGCGMTQYCGNDLVTGEELAFFAEAMRFSGRLDLLPERYGHAAGSLSGCGPAFAYLFLEALADGGVKCGLPRAKAMEYAAQTLIGAGEMVLQTGQHPGALKDAVCSPGGSTIRGVEALEQAAFRAAVISAVSAAFDRTKELGKA